MWSIQIYWAGRWFTIQTRFATREDAEWVVGLWKQTNNCTGDPFRAVQDDMPAGQHCFPRLAAVCEMVSRPKADAILLYDIYLCGCVAIDADFDTSAERSKLAELAGKGMLRRLGDGWGLTPAGEVVAKSLLPETAR